MSRFGRLLSSLFLASAFTFGTFAIAAGQPRLTEDSLQSLLEKALEAFGQSDFASAAEFFQRIEREFGREEDFQKEDFLRRMLPLRGHAELAAGQSAEAAASLERFVEQFPDDRQRPAALFGLASALRRDAKPEAAEARLREFIRAYPRRNEVPLAYLQRADVLFELGRAEEAASLLERFSEGRGPAALRNQARLRGARQAADSGRLDEARRFLLEFRWDVSTLPEIALLSFTALQVADLLMEAEQFEEAARAYRLVLPRARLLDLQEARIREIHGSLQRAGAGRTGFWNGYYRTLLASLMRQFEALREGEDYTPLLLLRRGQALLLIDRNHEAWLLFERLALDEDLASSVRQEAHYRWIMAASNLELWEEALTIARNFGARYPEAELAPQALYLIAQAHQEQRRYGEAAEVLADLLEKFPGHDMAQRWRFALGFNRALREEFAEAREDFRRAVTDYPAGPLAPNSQLWHALTYFFERRYEAALEEFDDLAGRYSEHPLEGEILYRRASTLYAMREYGRAEEEAAAFVEKFERHERYPEALVLLGDILMGAGELEKAADAFARIDPETGHLFLHGLFQRGKIFRATQSYDRMISLFAEYAERGDLEEKPRLSEALYWIGWAHAQRGNPEKAVPLFLSALEEYGDDPAAAEIGSILSLLQRLQQPLPGSGSFPDWLEDQRKKALRAGRPTYFSRLNLHLAHMRRQSKLPFQAEALLFEIADEVPVEKLGPDALGQVGRLMAERDLEAANEFFLHLLKEYPTAPERANAYHGLGRWHLGQKDFREALIWLKRFRNETPTHELASEALLLSGRALMELGRHGEAKATFEEILKLRAMRGRPHAAALVGLAETAELAGEPEQAVAYYQRTYTLHRAQADLTARAYYQSSLLLEELDDVPGAHRTLEEMLVLRDLARETEFLEKAQVRLDILTDRLPPTPDSP